MTMKKNVIVTPLSGKTRLTPGGKDSETPGGKTARRIAGRIVSGIECGIECGIEGMKKTAAGVATYIATRPAPYLAAVALRLSLVLMLLTTVPLAMRAQRNTDRISVGVGCLYERGLDATIAWERETSYHNEWEFFGGGYIKWDKCPSCGHVCPKSFWKNYRSYGFGIAWKPCVTRGRNNHGNIRLGASGGSDTHDFMAGIHAGYEHNYVLRHGWKFFWQAKCDVMIKGEDLFRTGIVIGVKLPVK